METYVNPLVFLGLALAGILVYLIVTSIRSRRKLMRQVEESFGKIPAYDKKKFYAENFWEAVQEKRPGPHIDDITWSDLAMDEVFQRINGCSSLFGDIALYLGLRQNKSNKAVYSRQGLLGCLEKNPKLREKIQFCLARIGRSRSIGMEVPVFYPQLLELKNKWLPYLMLLALPASLLLWPVFGVTVAVGAFALLLIVNFNYCAVIKSKNEGNISAMMYLSSAVQAGRQIAALLEPHAPEKAGELKQCLSAFSSLSKYYGVLAYSDGVIRAIGFDFSYALLLPIISYERIIHKLSRQSEQVEELTRLLGEVDGAAGVLSFRKSLPCWCEPCQTAEAKLEGKGIYHPLLASPVGNDGEFHRSVLLTGSNASGKSTFIKAVAINILFAQTINTCCAESFCCLPGMVASSMAVADDVIEGDSYFIAEIKSLRRLIQRAQKNEFFYFFIDEILKGTNTAERIGASAAVLEYLSARNGMVFTATHDTELPVMLKNKMDNYHFTETVSQGQVLFDYILRSGPATSRNALLLLETMGFPQEIVQEANANVRHWEDTGDWLRSD